MQTIIFLQNWGALVAGDIACVNINTAIDLIEQEIAMPCVFSEPLTNEPCTVQ
jgi:hypothetical protein